MSDTGGRACWVERLRLFRFRNYHDETVELGAGLTVLSGRNAQGKTSLLEAIATLALTRSPRAASAAELITWGEPACSVQALVRRPDGPVALDLRVARGEATVDGADDGASDRATRVVAVDGKPRPARALLGICPVVLFWPEDLQLVKGGPDGRRRLLDVVLSQLDPRVATELARYRRILEQRNALLKQVRAGATPGSTLHAFSAALARSGAVIQVARAQLCEQLASLGAPALEELSGGSEELHLRYAPHGADATTSVTDAAAGLTEALAAHAAEERARGVTVIGPHRDDVSILLGGRAARASASQGQQRSIVLALKLAEVRHVAAIAGMTPVLLLDDVLSELDAGRRTRLLLGLAAPGAVAQGLLTTSESDPLDELSELGTVRRLHVEAGTVRDPTPAGRP